MSIDFNRPDLAPETTVAADGKTTLHRFRIEAVVYAPDEAHARQRISQAGLYLDAAQLVTEES
jgi:serine protease inhibitor ecotin